MASLSWADVVSGKKIYTEDTTIPNNVTEIVDVESECQNNLKEFKIVKVEDRTKKPPPGFEHIIPKNKNTKKIIFKMKDKEIIEAVLNEQKITWNSGQNRVQIFIIVCLSISEIKIIDKKLKEHKLKLRIIGKDIEIIDYKV